METVYLKMRIRKTQESSPVVEEEFFVDAGIACALVPGDLLRRLGIEADGQETIFVGMDTLVRKTGVACFEFQGRSGYARVMFGEPGDANLVAASTLKALGLMLDPFTRELKELSVAASRE